MGFNPDTSPIPVLPGLFCLRGLHKAVIAFLVGWLFLNCIGSGNKDNHTLSGLTWIKDIEMPGSANRFDYQDIDPKSRRLYISHMGSNALIVFNLDDEKVIANIEGISRPTGVLAVHELGKIYVSASGTDEIVVVDEQSLKITGRIKTGDFPDGIAYDPANKKLFVSDEHGKKVTVIDAAKDRFIENIEMGGEVGNTHYDPVSYKIYSAVQSNNELVCIDPVSDKIISHIKTPGCEGPHGFYIDSASHFALITGEEKGDFVVYDLSSGKIIYTGHTGPDPDVLAFDPAGKKLYVSAESGIVSIFKVEKGAVTKVDEGFFAKHAHTISFDTKTRKLYFPIQDIKGKPVLRIMSVE